MSKKVLVISPVPSHPQDAGNRTRIYNLLRNLQKLGHEVHFLYIQQETKDDYLMRQAWEENFYSLPYRQIGDRKRSLAQKITRKLRCYLTDYPKYPGAVDDWYENSINHFLVELHRKVNFDVVIVEYVFFSKALNIFGKDVLKIIDTHDVFANRTDLYKNNGQEYYWYSTNIKEETKGLRRADLIIAIQKEEEEYFQKLVGNKVITVGHTVLLRRPKQMLLPAGNKILYIASLNETNIHGIKYFINDVLPKVRAKLPDIQLLIAGKICEALDKIEGCVKLGYVDNSNEIYDNANVVINPMCFGTGLKIKSIEALGQSKVLVTTLEGAKGLEAGANKAFLVAKDADEFSQYLIEVLTNSLLSSNLAKQAYDFAEVYNKKALEPLEKVLDSIPGL
ncbi:MAG: glycosyltransferase family 4 protein [Mojavia pulchra JT2-VF2]|jgi:glycosyltransferase involved in cell wall biosynthesis|uniref:Glycosyltransferase family 4 protein n=1 Tax=Mojavia pulchra JT2-VF2 TaxID=287848 RepID=A0A951PVC4_9NOST|nr:glycosyltransferase family 4 protein [Mojavia pulchra JT2-VF2]